MGDHDGSKRGPKPRVSDEEILDVFRDTEDPVLIAQEVADHLSINRRGTYDRLKKLEEQGMLHSKKLGGRTTIWWYPGYTSTPKN